MGNSFHCFKLISATFCVKRGLLKVVFPKGIGQVNRVIRALEVILEIDLDKYTTKKYIEILNIYVSGFVGQISGLRASEIMLGIHKANRTLVPNKEIASKVYALCIHNYLDEKFSLKTRVNINALNDTAQRMLEKVKLEKKYTNNQYNGEEQEDYGLSPKNPVYTNGVKGTKKYLHNLRTIEGDTLEWERKNVYIDGNDINIVVDEYIGICGYDEIYGRVYVNENSNGIPRKAPQGFTFSS